MIIIKRLILVMVNFHYIFLTGLDGKRIIIFGGYFINPGYLDTTLYVLDLANYNWYIPKISGKIPKPRALHQANVIGKYMVVSFGKYNIP